MMILAIQVAITLNHHQHCTLAKPRQSREISLQFGSLTGSLVVTVCSLE